MKKNMFEMLKVANNKYKTKCAFCSNGIKYFKLKQLKLPRQKGLVYK